MPYYILHPSVRKQLFTAVIVIIPAHMTHGSKVVYTVNPDKLKDLVFSRYDVIVLTSPCCVALSVEFMQFNSNFTGKLFLSTNRSNVIANAFYF